MSGSLATVHRAARACALLAPLLAGGCRDAPEPGRAAILITLDTLRADALGCYGSPAGATPRLDALAAESVLYERAHTVTPLTLPAHASMLTGLYPLRHGVRKNVHWALSPDAHTLPEAARAAGYDTGAFLAAAVLADAFGLDQGFATYDAPLEKTRDADEVLERALAWVRRAPERSFLLWVHLFDPHAPYEPPAGYREGRWRGRPYLGEVAAMDAALGRFLDALRGEGVLSRATVAVVADHGEAFGEHGELTHGEVCYQTTMRVPFVVRHPDGARGGERSREIVSVADVAPTLAAALGLSLGDGDLDGQSLLAPVSAERGAYFESYQGYLQEGLSPLAGWLDREGKYLASSEPRYFDVWEDPAEERNVITERGDAVGRARERIAALAAKDRLAGVEPDSIEDEVLAQAQALGYAGTLLDEGRPLPDPLAPTSLPAPGRVTRARFALQQGRALVGSGRYAEAEPVLRDALAGLPEEHAPLALTRGSVWFNLGIVLLCGEPERRDEALAAFRRALALDPRLDGELARLRALLAGRGREEDARFLEREL